MTDDALQSCSSKSLAIQLGMGVGTSASSAQCTADRWSTLGGIENGQSTFKQFTKGSRPATSFNEWKDSVFTPSPLHYELVPIVNLLAYKHLYYQKGMQLDAPRLRKWFVAMYYNYCKVMGISCTGMSIYNKALVKIKSKLKQA